MRKYLKNLFNWVFQEEINELQIKIKQCETERILLKEQISRTKNVLANFDVSVDVHHHSPSWAVISLQGEKTDYLKFISLNNSTIRDIHRFLSQFDRENNIKIDCSPMEYLYFREFKNNTLKIKSDGRKYF